MFWLSVWLWRHGLDSGSPIAGRCAAKNCAFNLDFTIVIGDYIGGDPIGVWFKVHGGYVLYSKQVGVNTRINKVWPAH